MKLAAAMIIPLILIGAGLLLLIGCFPVPATQQLQPDLKPRPEFYVGTDEHKPVRIGQTRIEDAFIELSRRVSKETHGNVMGTESTKFVPRWSLYKWNVSLDRRQFALHYTVRTATWVAPLCFYATPQTKDQWLVLDVNPHGIVTGSRTVNQRPVFGPFGGDWLDVFDAPTRRKLYDAGVFPPDEHLEMVRQNLIRQRARLGARADAPASKPAENHP